MERIRCESQDLRQANIDKLAKIFPEVITETVDKHGNLTRSVNFETLRLLLGEDIPADSEKYEFSWVGKKAAIGEASSPIRKKLHPSPEESKNWDNTENLYLEGDNLDILKLLQQSYPGKISVIYIDPPYNTGKNFIYQDDFKISNAEWKQLTGECGKNEEAKTQRMFNNIETNGRFHSLWCSMIYPRLLLARNLLTETGVIFISCDNNELANLKKICDEIFGHDNFITNLAVENNPKGRKNNAFVAESYEYCLLYTKNITYIHEFLRKNKIKKFFNNLDNNNDRRQVLHDESGEFRQSKRQVCGTNKSSALAAHSRPERCFSIYFNSELDKIELLSEYDSKSDQYILSPRGRQLLENNYKRFIALNSEVNRPAIPLYTSKKISDLFKENSLYFKEDGSIYEKDRESGQQINSFISNKKYSLDLMTESATAKMEDLFCAKNIFANSKSLDFIKALLFLYPARDFIILDFFSGSATTAHAVMQLNAEDGGKRKFIMVQLPEVCAPDSEAAKAGFRNICEIGKERIRRAGEKIKAEKGIFAEGVDIGFRVLKCDPINRKDVYYLPKELSQVNLQDYISNIREDISGLDLLFSCISECGLPLSRPLEIRQICGHTIYIYDKDNLVCCFDANLDEDCILEIAKLKPLCAVFRKSCFKDSSHSINTEKLFKSLMPNTAVKVL